MSRRGAYLGGAVLLVALALPACATMGEGDGASEVTGCYQFVRTGEVNRLGLPWGFVLTDEPLEGWPRIEGGRVAETAIDAERRTDTPFSYWQPREGDTIRVGYPAGGAGYALDLVPVGQDLEGTARAVGDVMPRPGEESARGPFDVVARRVACGVP